MLKVKPYYKVLLLLLKQMVMHQLKRLSMFTILILIQGCQLVMRSMRKYFQLEILELKIVLTYRKD